MSLFRNTADLKLFADIHKQTAWETLRLYVEQAENDHIIPLIGQDEFNDYDSMINLPDNANKPLSEIITTPVRYKLFLIIARSLANFALYEAFPFLNTAVGDAGVQQLQGKEGTSTAAPQWRYESRRSAHLTVADTYADKMLEFLEKNASDFPLWASSENFTLNKDLLISSSASLAEYIGTNDSRRAYIAIRPYIRLAEKQVILPIVGPELFAELKAQAITNPSSFSTGNTRLLSYVKEALAWTAYYLALPFISIRINGDGVQVVSKNDSINSRNAATKDEKDIARATAGRLSDSAQNSLRQFMDINADTYPLYKTYWLDRFPVTTFRRKQNRRDSGHFAV